MEEVLDVVVIGAGPGGYVAALRAAQNGLKTALVERDTRLGGTCLLRGCIPTKSLLQTAALLEKMGRADEFGIEFAGAQLNLEKAIKRKNRIVAKLSAGVAGLMKKYGVKVIKGRGRLDGAGTVIVESETEPSKLRLSAKNIILATGSRVKDLPFAAPDHKQIVTSDSILDLQSVPKKLLVLGAGAVGMEFASIFRSFGSEVKIIEMMPRLLPLEDEDVSKEMERAWKRRQIEAIVGAKVVSVEKSEGSVKVSISRGASGAENLETFEADMLLVASGRKPVSEDLGLETVGVKTDRGYVIVDSLMRTNVEGIWAIGDLVPTLALAHVASHEAIVAADAIAGKKVEAINYDFAPSATYTQPEAAAVGLTEAAARAKGYSVRVGRFPFAAIGKASVIGETEGFVKIIADERDRKVLGAHIVGPHATELISEAAAALQCKATIDDLVRTIHPHPTVSESIGEASHAWLGHTINL